MTTRTVTLTPESEGRALRLADCTPDSTVVVQLSEWWSGSRSSADLFAAGHLVITSITRESTEQELPVRGWYLGHKDPGAGPWYFNGERWYTAEGIHHEHSGQPLDAPFTLLAPRDATRQEVIDWYESYARTVGHRGIDAANVAARAQFLPTQKGQ